MLVWVVFMDVCLFSVVEQWVCHSLCAFSGLSQPTCWLCAARLDPHLSDKGMKGKVLIAVPLRMG